MEKKITGAQATGLLKQHGFEVQDMAGYLGIQPNSLSVKWSRGLTISNTLDVYGYLFLQSPALADKQYLSLMQQAYERRDESPIREALAIIRNELEKDDG